MTSRRTRTTSGFTMIELIVSIGLFTTIMLIITGSFLAITDAARKARATRIALDNVSASLDYMAREIRLGSYFRCENDSNVDTPDTPSDPESCQYGGAGGTLLAFERAGGGISNNTDQIVFRLNGATIERSVNCCNGSETFEALTSSDIVIDELRFFVEGTNHPAVSPADADQPRITILIRGVAGGSKVRTQVSFALQTTLAARTPNIDPAP